MQGINISEQCHVVNGVAPISFAGGKTAYVNMAGYGHATIILTYGAAVNISTVTLFKSADSSGTGEHAIEILNWYKEITASGDVLDKQTAEDTAGFTTASDATANTMYTIEVDAAELGEDHPWLGVKASSAGAQLAAIIIILSGGTYQGQATPTVLA